MSSNHLESVEQDNSPSGGDHLRLNRTDKTVSELKLIKETQQFPLKTSTHVYKQQIEGADDIDIVINQFADNILIIVTDIAKPGSIFKVTRDTSKNIKSQGSTRGSDFLYSVELLLGAETPELITTARFLGQYVNAEKPILLTLGFKNPKTSLAPTYARNLVAFIKNQLC